MMSTQFLMAAIAILLLFSTLPTIDAQDVDPISFSTLPTCIESSLTIAGYGAEDVMDPCLLYDIQDDDMKSSNIVDAKTTEVALVQVTPSTCNNHRDGAVTSVKLLNGDNDGRGMAIGHNRDHFLKFRLISIVGGNPNNIGNDAYSEIHSQILDSTLKTINNTQYILGSCSFASLADKPVALENQKVVISQVGPPGFYMDVETNPYVFGIHVNSDTYPLPALSALTFQLNSKQVSTSTQQVRVLYRTKSEFFYSTCRSAIDTANEKGFDVTEVEYDPDMIQDDSDVPNSQNVPFLEEMADQLCPPRDTVDDTSSPPAIFACVLNFEADTILARMRSNGCRPLLAWFTTATWGWATSNPDVIPYYNGGGQWHENFVYSDKFFNTGQEVLDYGLKEFGYSGSYDHVVSYAMPTLIQSLLQSYFRVEDFPDVGGTFTDRYEVLRRALVNLNAQTIFGPVQFNEFQRNNGRGAAGTQWLPSTSITSDGNEEEGQSEYVLACISPFDQANAALVVPSPSGTMCSPGSYLNGTSIQTEAAILDHKCGECPSQSYTSVENVNEQCNTCPQGTETYGTGSTFCVQLEENLIGPLGIMGYIFVAVSWAMSLGYLFWIWRYKTDSVVKISQPEFLTLICVGAIISSSAIIPWTMAEAGVDEDTAAADRNCVAWPWLYAIGWSLMYSSLTAKSLRLYKMANAAAAMRRKAVTAKEMYKVVIVWVLIDVLILTAWTAYDPLTWQRTEVDTSIESSGIVTVSTIGKCHSDTMYYFLGPLIAVHVTLMIVTNVLLYKVRNIGDRYQEQKYVALASIYICELLLLGLPILIAVQDSAQARYFVIAGVIFLTDTGVLSLIFLPKIKFQRDGLPEGVSVVQSMNITSRASTVRRASTASYVDKRRLSLDASAVSSGPSQIEASDTNGRQVTFRDELSNGGVKTEKVDNEGIDSTSSSDDQSFHSASMDVSWKSFERFLKSDDTKPGGQEEEAV